MQNAHELTAPTLVEAVDRVTRAVHIGARLPGAHLPGARGRPLDTADRAYLGGFIAELVGALNLDGGFAELVVYAYLLQEGMEADAARLSRLLLRQPQSPELARAFGRGQAEAGAYLRTGRSGLQGEKKMPACSGGTERRASRGRPSVVAAGGRRQGGDEPQAAR